MKKSLTLKNVGIASTNLSYLASFLDNGKVTSVTWVKNDGDVTRRAVKSAAKSELMVQGQYLVIKDTNAREYKGGKIGYRKINLLTVKHIKQGNRQLFL